MSKKKKVGIVLLMLVLLVFVVAGLGYFGIRSYYKSTNYMSDEEVKQMIQEQLQMKLK